MVLNLQLIRYPAMYCTSALLGLVRLGKLLAEGRISNFRFPSQKERKGKLQNDAHATLVKEEERRRLSEALQAPLAHALGGYCSYAPISRPGKIKRPR